MRCLSHGSRPLSAASLGIVRNLALSSPRNVNVSSEWRSHGQRANHDCDPEGSCDLVGVIECVAIVLLKRAPLAGPQ
jgi:hypothetical protein